MLDDHTLDVFDLFGITQEPAAPTTKTCRKCGEDKPLSGFYRNRNGKYGRRSDCKACTNAHKKAYWTSTPERVASRREFMRDHQREYRRKHPDRALATVERGKDAQRAKREAKKRPQVYRIDFADGCYYIGKSNNPKRRFHQHRHAARHGTHVKALKGQDWSTATWRVLVECGTEAEAVAAEYRIIEESMDDPKNLNTRTKEKWVKPFYVYVIQSEQKRVSQKTGRVLPGYFYVGMTTCPARRLREHNGRYANGKMGKKGGGKWTSKHRPWVARACYGPYYSRSEALKAEYRLKRSKRGKARCHWSPEDSPLCRGEGVDHPWVSDPVGWRPPKA
jgi:predicted GIY-YIG superfamily endonuclease